MDTTTIIPVTPTEVVDIHKDGIRSGFIAGVIFCIGANYLNNRRKRYAELVRQQKM